MTITLEAKPLEYEVEIPGYGVFTLRRLGAGAEADLSARMREIEDMQKQFHDDYGDVLKQEKKVTEEKDKEALDKLQESEHYKQAEEFQKELNSRIQKLNGHITQVHLSLWRTDKPENLEKLKNDLTIGQITDLYRQAMKLADEEEK